MPSLPSLFVSSWHKRRAVLILAAAAFATGLSAAPAHADNGKTFFLSHDHTITILPLVVKTPGFDPAKDFVPVAGFATFVNALAVSGGTPTKSVNEYLKSSPP